MLNISPKEFERVQQLMYSKTGVSLRPSKKQLVIARLRNRLQELNLTNFTQYIELISQPHNKELEVCINAITTNETFFFRHAIQFNYLYETILPEMLKRNQCHINAWSGACSTGEEPYSLAITLREFYLKNPALRFQIDATDINTEVLSEAREGKYDAYSLKQTPPNLAKKYFSASLDSKGGGICQVVPEIKRCVNFDQFNLKTDRCTKLYDIILLRNVLIYFDNDSKQEVIHKMEQCLKPGGYFFVSLSETLNDVKTSLRFIHSAMYQKDSD